jgi:hypothetical protein
MNLHRTAGYNTRLRHFGVKEPPTEIADVRLFTDNGWADF